MLVLEKWPHLLHLPVRAPVPVQVQTAQLSILVVTTCPPGDARHTEHDVHSILWSWAAPNA